jgi:hypothetical protein
MCDVPSIAVFCSESIECFPGTVSKFFLKLFVTIPVAPIITGITVPHFLYKIYRVSINIRSMPEYGILRLCSIVSYHRRRRRHHHHHHHHYRRRRRRRRRCRRRRRHHQHHHHYHHHYVTHLITLPSLKWTYTFFSVYFIVKAHW